MFEMTKVTPATGLNGQFWSLRLWWCKSALSRQCLINTKTNCEWATKGNMMMHEKRQIVCILSDIYVYYSTWQTPSFHSTPRLSTSLQKLDESNVVTVYIGHILWKDLMEGTSLRPPNTIKVSPQYAAFLELTPLLGTCYEAFEPQVLCMVTPA